MGKKTRPDRQESRTTLSRRFRLAVAVPAVVALFVLGFHAWSLGLASLDHWQARQLVLELQGSTPVDEDLANRLLPAARDRLAAAESRRRGLPESFGLAGQLQAWEAVNLAPFGSERNSRLQSAIEHYREAIRLRPTWPYYWAGLALAKAEQGRFDPEFRHALRRAVETGPWEPRIQLALVRMDFIEGSRIDRRSRERIDGVIARGLKRQPNALLRLADQFGQVPRVCALVEKGDARLQAHCDRSMAD